MSWLANIPARLRDPRRLVLANAIVFAAAIWAYALYPVVPRLTLTVLDVGEGLCAVVRTPCGKTIVVDCGTCSWRESHNLGSKLVAPYLQSIGVNVIDLAVLTHPHSDHISGYASLLGQLPAKTVLDIGPDPDCPDYEGFIRMVHKCQAKHYVARSGQVFVSPEGVQIQILNPDVSRSYEDLNNKSIALRIVYKQVAFLVAGDVEEQGENYIIQSFSHLQSEVLVVGHHGAHKSCSPQWLAAVKPLIAIISCGRNNPHGHPSPLVIQRLRSFGIRTYRTDINGAVMASTDGKSVSIRVVRRQ